MKDNTIRMNDLKYIDDDVFQQIQNYTISSKDLYLTIAGTIGSVGVVPKELDGMNLTENAAKLTNIGIDRVFLMYALLSTESQEHFSSRFHQVAQPKLSLETASSTMIPMPPLAEQRRIVEKIQALLYFIDTLEYNINFLDSAIAQTKSKILELAMQGKLVPQDPSDEPAADMLRRINPNAKIITDNPHYPQLPDNWVLTNVESVCNYGCCTTIPVENIGENEWILELEDIEKNSGKVIEKKNKTHRKVNGVRHKFKEGDILYSKLRTYLNKVLLANTEGYCTTEIIPISCYDCIDQQYLCHWLRSPSFLAYTLSCGYGVKMPRLSTLDARNGIVPLPPLNEQKRIVTTIDLILKSLDSILRNLDFI